MKQFVISILVFGVLVGGVVYFSHRASAPEGGYAVSPSISPSESASPTAVASVSPSATAPVVSTKPTKNRMHTITLKTNFGDITFETYDLDAPKTVTNFITLAQKGFYTNVIFHRVINGFMIQGGDPTGTGRGGPGYQFEDELNAKSESYKAGYVTGVVAMANAGPNTNGSQFFIMHKDYPLAHNYTIFGKVTVGQDVVDKIATTATDSNDRPIKDVVIQSVEVKNK